MSDKEIDSLMTEAIVDAIEKLPDGEAKEYLRNKVEEVTAMCVYEYDLERARNWSFNEGKEEGIAEGKREGREEGENMLADLLLHLNAAGRFEESAKVLTDKNLRQQLLNEFGIVGQSTTEQ